MTVPVGDVHRHGDDVDRGVGEELSGIAIAGARAKRLGGLVGRGLVAGDDGAEFEPREALDGGHVGDLRPTPLGAGADDPDLQGLVHRSSPSPDQDRIRRRRRPFPEPLAI